jgi:hypothetical protein
VETAVSFTEGLATQYWRHQKQHLMESLGNPHVDTSPLVDLEAFLQLMRSKFFPTDYVLTIRDKLMTLKQTRSVSVYAEEFETLLLQLPPSEYSEQDMKDAFTRGLKRDVQIQVQIAGPATLTATVQTATRIDGILFRSRSDHAKSGFGNRPFGAKPFQRPHQARPSDAMDVDNVNIAAGKKRIFKCYNCGKPGHYAKDCRSPKKTDANEIEVSAPSSSGNEEQN